MQGFLFLVLAELELGETVSFMLSLVAAFCAGSVA